MLCSHFSLSHEELQRFLLKHQQRKYESPKKKENEEGAITINDVVEMFTANRQSDIERSEVELQATMDLLEKAKTTAQEEKLK
jgi:hypothetical protein